MRWTRSASALSALAVLALLGGCNRGADEREPPPPPPADRQPPPRLTPPADGEDPNAGVTPMAERVAVLGLLNKRNGLVRDITLRPGESIRVGRAVIRLRACERTAQWESPQETGAFVQLLVLEYRSNEWRRVFSGWLFRDRPERNIVQHPIYDVFVRSCTMRWPGEIDPAELDVPEEASNASSAAQRPPAPARSADTAPPAPAPAAPATPTPSGDDNADAAEDTAG